MVDKITELINKKDYYVITKTTNFRTRSSKGTSKIRMTMHDSYGNIVKFFEGDEYDNHNTVYAGLNGLLEKVFPNPLYEHEHIEKLFDEIKDVELPVHEVLRNKPILVKSDDGEYRVLLKSTYHDSVVLSFNPLHHSDMIGIKVITNGEDLSRLHSYIHIIEEYFKVPVKEREEELNSIDNLENLM